MLILNLMETIDYLVWAIYFSYILVQQLAKSNWPLTSDSRFIWTNIWEYFQSNRTFKFGKINFNSVMHLSHQRKPANYALKYESTVANTKLRKPFNYYIYNLQVINPPQLICNSFTGWIKKNKKQRYFHTILKHQKCFCSKRKRKFTIF